MGKRKLKGKPTPMPKPSEDKILKEYCLAYERLGGAIPAKRLQWLLSLSQLELDKLSQGRLADLRWEAVAFGVNKNPEHVKSRFDLGLELHALTVLAASPDWGPGDHAQKAEALMAEGAPLELMREFQETMRHAFNELYGPQRSWKVKRPSREELIALDLKTEEGHWPSQGPAAFTGAELLLIQAIDLIKAERTRLKECQNPRCKRRFVAAKKGRAFFHSQKCSAYVRVNKTRGRKI
jgi:hypothetical protein